MPACPARTQFCLPVSMADKENICLSGPAHFKNFAIFGNEGNFTPVYNFARCNSHQRAEYKFVQSCTKTRPLREPKKDNITFSISSI